MSAPNPFRLFTDRPDWFNDAACRGWPLDWWHPPRGDTNVNKAKKICAQCPVATECLQYAIDNDETMGIWGGISINLHRRMRRPKTGRTSHKGRAPEPIVHGTLAGYAKERRRGIEHCDACREANRQYQANRKRNERRRIA